MLSRQGHHVLRFDYYGTGDSAGSVTETLPDTWVGDVKLAAAELLDLSAARSLSLVGLRLGAAVALDACRMGLKARSLVLWEPVLSGKAYLDELVAADRIQRTLLLHWVSTLEPCTELLGYPHPAELDRAIRKVDASVGPAPRVERVLVVAANTTPETHAFTRALSAQGIEVRLESVSTTSDGPSRNGKALLSTEALTAIAQHWAEAPRP